MQKSRASRASLRSIRQSATCAGLTLPPNVSDQHRGNLLEQNDRLAVLPPAPVDDRGGVREELGPVIARPPVLSAHSPATIGLSSLGSKPGGSRRSPPPWRRCRCRGVRLLAPTGTPA